MEPDVRARCGTDVGSIGAADWRGYSLTSSDKWNLVSRRRTSWAGTSCCQRATQRRESDGLLSSLLCNAAYYDRCGELNVQTRKRASFLELQEEQIL